MKQLMVCILLCSLYVSSCKKENSVDEVTYEVTLISATSWHGGYLDENAQAVSLTTAPTNWKYTFKNSNNLTAVTIQAFADGLNSAKDAMMKIYVNGNVVAQGKSSASPQLQYIFP